MDVRFEPVSREHLPMLAEWLHRHHWLHWWGEPEVELSYIRDMIEGRDTTCPYIFHIGGEPMGYIQCWFIGDHQSVQWIADHPWLAGLQSDAVGVDLSIADPRMLSKGIGSRVLQTFVARLVADGWRTIIIDPDPGNGRAVRAYEKAGFRAIPELVGKSGDSLIMRYEPETVSRTE
ncbi:MAG: acetyltransferase [Alphaproteobacteria bacterium]|nr:acetyltransferase [Alphaproteobacteria bacterium]